MSQAQVPSQLALPAPPSLADFKFNTIGQLPALGRRITDADADYRSPSPDIPELNTEASTSSRLRSRPTLLQALANHAVSDESPEDLRSDGASLSQGAIAASPPNSHLSLSPPVISSSHSHSHGSLLAVSDSFAPPPAGTTVQITSAHLPFTTTDPQRDAAPTPAASHLPVEPIHPESLYIFRSPSPISSNLLPRLFAQLQEREDGMLKVNNTFDSKAIELSRTVDTASTTAQAMEDRITALRVTVQQMRTQADAMFAGAIKMREFAEQAAVAADNMQADLARSRAEIGAMGEKSGVTTHLMRQMFSFFQARHVREQETVDKIQKELIQRDEQRKRAQIEKRQRAEARKAEEERRKALLQAAEEQRLANERREEEANARKEAERQQAEIRKREAAEVERKAAEEEAERLKAIAEEEERQKTYQAMRAAALANKYRDNADNATASAIATAPVQAASVASVPSTAHSSSTSHSPPSISPFASLPPKPPIALPPPVSPMSRKPTKNAAPAGFVPAQTEAGREVRTDMPFGNTTLASELQARRQAGSQIGKKNVGPHGVMPGPSATKLQGKEHVAPPKADTAAIKREPSAEQPVLRALSSPREQKVNHACAVVHPRAPNPIHQEPQPDPRSRSRKRNVTDGNVTRAPPAEPPHPAPRVVSADFATVNAGDNHAFNRATYGSGPTPGEPVGDGGWGGPDAIRSDPRTVRPQIRTVQTNALDRNGPASESSRGRRSDHFPPDIHHRYSPSASDLRDVSARRSTPPPGRRQHDHYSPTPSPVRDRLRHPNSISPRSRSPVTSTVPTKRTLARSSWPEPLPEPPRSRMRIEPIYFPAQREVGPYDPRWANGSHVQEPSRSREPRSSRRSHSPYSTIPASGTIQPRRSYPRSPSPTSPAPQSSIYDRQYAYEHLHDPEDRHSVSPIGDWNVPYAFDQRADEYDPVYPSHPQSSAREPTYDGYDRLNRVDVEDRAASFVEPYHPSSAPDPMDNTDYHPYVPPSPELGPVEKQKSGSLLSRMKDSNSRARQPSSNQAKGTRGGASTRGKNVRQRTDGNGTRHVRDLASRITTSTTLQERIS